MDWRDMLMRGIGQRQIGVDYGQQFGPAANAQEAAAMQAGKAASKPMSGKPVYGSSPINMGLLGYGLNMMGQGSPSPMLENMGQLAGLLGPMMMGAK